MGGLMFLAGIAVGTLLWADLSDVYVWVVLLVTMAFGFLGFLDDYAKVTRQTTAGLSSMLRLLVEGGVAVLAVFLVIKFAQPTPDDPQLATSVAFPILKRALLDLGLGEQMFQVNVVGEHRFLQVGQLPRRPLRARHRSG
jgi:phospho-N-acetylmuramoyl-pentapeptide-transferase